MTRLAKVPCSCAAFILAAVLALAPATAVGEGVERGTLEQLRRDFSQVDRDRQAYVNQRMDLSGQAANDFQIAYQDYLQNLARLRERQLVLLLEHNKDLNNGNLTDSRASVSLAESLRLDRERLKTRERLVIDLDRSLSPQQRLRLYQLELAFDVEARAELLPQIPLAK